MTARRQPVAAPPRQSVLDLPPSPPRMSRADFVGSDSNAHALATIEAWAASDEPVLAICGPKGSGKTHLARILESEADGSLVIIDDVDDAAPREVFAAVEKSSAGGDRLVLVGRGDPKDWADGLVDLETRLRACPRVTLAEPDEALLRAVMTKLFADRQVKAADSIIDHAAQRIPKTFTAAQAFVEAFDAASMEAGGRAAVRLAREIVANLSEAPFDAYFGGIERA